MKKLSKQEETSLKDLGKRIAKFRTAAKLTQEELAHNLDMERPSITRIEGGRTNPTFIMLKRICVQLDIELKDLL